MPVHPFNVFSTKVFHRFSTAKKPLREISRARACWSDDSGQWGQAAGGSGQRATPPVQVSNAFESFRTN